MAPVVNELEKHEESIRSVVCVTAQHRQMLDQMLNLFRIVPDYDLGIMRDNQTLMDVTVSVLTKLNDVIEKEQPDWLLVQGDTTTAMAGSLAAFYQRVKIGHVEAGLRTWNKFAPYPEEINRRVVDMIADLYFVPTENTRRNLLSEDVAKENIVVAGNTVVDALLDIASRDYTFKDITLTSIPFNSRQVILVTAHRRENFGKPLQNICNALLEIARICSSTVHIVYPVHLNSNVKDTVYPMLKGVHNISLVNPLDYLSFVNIMKRSHIILTDSGGIQEEAPSLDKPVLVLRDVTERPEGVEAGAVRVIGTNQKTIIEETIKLLKDQDYYEKMANAKNPYGDGTASIKIVNKLLAST